MSRIEELKSQIAQIDELLRNGTLSGDDARKARAKLEPSCCRPCSSPAAPALMQRRRCLRRHQRRYQRRLRPVRHRCRRRTPTKALVGGVTAFVLAVGLVGYAVLGNREGLSVAPGQAVAAAPGANDAAHPVGAKQIEGMLAKLVQRLKEQPGDAEGWSMLGRSYSVLGRHQESLAAYRKVIELKPNDAQGYADLADAVGSLNNNSLDGEPEKLIAKALSLDPDYPKALFLSGTLSFKRGDHAAAAKLWERAMRGMDPASNMAQQLQGALDEARQRAGLPKLTIATAAPNDGPNAAPNDAAAAPPGPGVAPAAQASPQVAAAGAAAIQGKVQLADALKGKVSPEDTVFIFARPVAGGRAPLAILRKQVKDLPLAFTLDESMAMSPAMSLGTVKEAIVGARISKSGQAMPQPGDLQGLSGNVSVGAQGVLVEINQTLP